MIVIDTSAWVEFLRGTDSAVCRRVDVILAEPTAVCDAIRMEVLAGARGRRHLTDLRGLLARTVTLPTVPEHWEDAARLYRQCRGGGETPRKLIDCLIAAVAIEAGLPVLHADVDFEVLQRHTALQLA